jgi:3',5'-cyclic AMP phosphodiesterase CpdA
MGKINVRHKGIGTFFLIVLALGFACTAQAQQIGRNFAELEKLPSKFSFVVIGDNRSGDDTYRTLVKMLMERRPDFVVNTGDMIAMPGDKRQWARFWEMSKPITVPYFLTVGNHDLQSKVLGSEAIYKEEVNLPGNELYYSFIAGNSLFIVLDTSFGDQEKKITGAQYAWLEGVLSNSNQKHKFVFLHHPLYTDSRKGKHAGNSLDRYPKKRNRLEALFVENKVDFVFSGHEHLYRRKVVDGINHVVTGGGGAPLYAEEKDGGFHHFVLVTVDGGRVSGEVMDINGRIRDRF